MYSKIKPIATKFLYALSFQFNKYMCSHVHMYSHVYKVAVLDDFATLNALGFSILKFLSDTVSVELVTLAYVKSSPPGLTSI